MALSPDHKTVASITSERFFSDGVSFSDAQTGKFSRRLGESFALPGARRDSVKFSPDGTRLAVARFAGMIEIWDTASEKMVARLPGRADEIRLAFSPDGRRLASFGRPRRRLARRAYDLRIWTGIGPFGYGT